MNGLFSDEELASYNPLIRRKVGCNLRGFLLEQRIAGPLEGIQVDTLEKFSESYEHARHEPAVSFTLVVSTDEYLSMKQSAIYHQNDNATENPRCMCVE